MALTRALLPLLVALSSAQQCGDIACDASETCCLDHPGCTGDCSECCMTQVTQCVAPRGRFKTSTCCPIWTVGCESGGVGCCDPARPWQLSTTAAHLRADPLLARRPGYRRRPAAEEAPAAEALPADTVAPSVLASSSAAAASAVGYAVFTQAFGSGLRCLQIDLGSGNVTASHIVSGPVAQYYKAFSGEATRYMPWDAAGRRFVFADLVAGALTVYTIDPSSGASTAAAVSGCAAAGYPVGQAWDAAEGTLLLGTQTASTASFCTVSVEGAMGAPAGSVERGSSETNSTAFYAAYVSHAHGGVAYRVGHRLVYSGDDPGLGTTKLGGGRIAASTSWKALGLDSAHGYPATMQRHPAGGFVSLAPKVAGGSYDIVRWSAGGGNVEVLANLTDAMPPYVPFVNTRLGYVGDGLDEKGATYAALTVARHPFFPPGAADKWTVSSLDLAAAGGAAEAAGQAVSRPLRPQPSFIGAETVDLCGFGVGGPPGK